MIDGPFRAWLPSVAKPLVATYSFFKLTPNVISISSVAIAFIAAYLCAHGHALAALATWWLGRLFDGTDGIYARATGQTSEFGAYLDIVCDMASYSIMIVGFSLLQPQHQLLWVLILFLYVLCITSALALGSLEQNLGITVKDNRGLRLGAGLAEGGETGIAYSLFLLFPNAIGTMATLWLGVLILTVLARSILAYRIFSARST